tara:strand:+ start:8 stop:364 length:357 start_codon:yes stop_codon:yes gene_type:complete
MKKEKLLYLNKVTARISHRDSSSGKKAEFLSRFRESGKCMGKKPGKIGIFRGRQTGKTGNFENSRSRRMPGIYSVAQQAKYLISHDDDDDSKMMMMVIMLRPLLYRGTAIFMNRYYIQ